ncbi:ninja-family protein AFP3-like [Syzygium oleosum]|uniref:ninja-family protein AFP3-like n=1 Tax=Syzygium oleosum TaxID=219896 RepID=UPI0011D2918B|nr:ninja-family protein AFP3-like [Syzygium oleosum]
MGDGKEVRRTSSPMENVSLRLERFPRDLLQRFTSSSSSTSGSGAASQSQSQSQSRPSSEYRTPNQETEELELSLGLSLGGRFGVDKSSKRLTRSSSIAGSFPLFREDDSAARTTPPTPSYTALVRSSSLPTETEEEWRKRKELQTLRRMEAKRRRSEKQRSVKDDKLEIETQVGVPAAKQGSSGCSDARSSLGSQTLQQRVSQDTVGSSGGVSVEQMTSTQGPDSSESRGKETSTSTMEDMPCVFTKGEGPNGRRVDGILYKYGKGEEVRIMCVCHGSFYSPAEFVKHAGGGEVAHPLRHIVINPNPGPFPR